LNLFVYGKHPELALLIVLNGTTRWAKPTLQCFVALTALLQIQGNLPGGWAVPTKKAVSTIIERTEQRTIKDRNLKKRIEQIKHDLMSQEQT